MRAIIILAVSLLHAVNAAPQFVTFKDGKIGVNFGGYHAEAGLGGLLTGNAAHGGLSASAGTPWGPKAAAGLGGGLDGRSTGLIYAGAEANPSVGASAVLGGSAGERGFIGSEAHAYDKVSSNSLGVEGRPHISIRSEPVTDAPPPVDVIQKIKPPKKYHLIKNEDTHPSTVDHSVEANLKGNDANVANDNPTLMINVHRQRMRERRRQQQQEEQANEQIERKRVIERRVRNYQRLHPRQRLVERTKTVDINVTQAEAPQQTHQQGTRSIADSKQANFDFDANVVHSKHLVKSVQKSGVDAPGYVPERIYPGPAPPVTYNANPGLLGNVLNIPIGILRVIQDSVTGGAHSKTIKIN